MKNRRDDTPEISDYTYYVFQEIEKRGLQFAIPDKWRPLYRAYLRKRKIRLATIRSDAARYSQDFGNSGTETPKEDPKTD